MLPQQATFRAGLAVLLAVTPIAAHADAATVDGPLAARIDTFMTRCVDLGLQGTLLVEKDGRVILHRGYGLVDRERRRPARTDTPYHLASLGKQFTAVAVLQLEARGLLRTSDPIARHLPGVPLDKQAITIDHLLHHTSGMPYLPAGGLEDEISLSDHVREVLAESLIAAPGERYSYSNTGYSVLAAIVERASKERYADYLRAHVFRPAGMLETSTDDDARFWTAARRTPSYTGDSPDVELFPWVGRHRMTGAGSAVSTTGDLWKWEQALRSHRVLDAPRTAKLFEPAVRINDALQHACGWNVARSARNTKVIMHAGDFGGFNVDYRRLVEENATIVFLGNSRSAGRGFREAVSIAVTRLLFGPPPVMPPARMALDPADRKAWDTAWAVGAADSIFASLSGGDVVLRARTQGAMSAIAGSDSAARALEARLSVRAREIAPRLLAGDLGAISPVIHPSVSSGSHPEYPAVWRAVADTLGGDAQVEVLGTAATGAAGGRTFVRLSGPRGARVLSLDWAQDHLLNTGPVPAGALELKFVPVAPDRVERFDLWAGRTTSIRRPG